MTREEKIQYWISAADYDWQVVQHLFEKGDYPYALFLGHLSLEKLLKAFFVERHDKTPPFTHRLLYLAEQSELALTDGQIELLETVTDFNLEARYPDEKFAFHRRCTKEFTKSFLDRIGEMRLWLRQQIQSF